MGWSRGSEVFQDVYNGIRIYIPEDKMVEVCSRIIISLQKMDWDCEDDFDNSDWPEYEEALRIANVLNDRKYL